MALSGAIRLALDTTMTSALDLSTSQDVLSLVFPLTITDGVGANQSNRHFSDRRALAASASEDVDLSGALTDAFGASLALTKVKAVIVINRSGNGAGISVRGAASNGVANFMPGAHVLADGGAFATFDFTAAGWTVAPGTGDKITVTNLSGSVGATYDIYVIGSQ